MDPVDLLLHPVRLRIVHAMSGGRTLTTTQLCARLSDVPKATLYRHVGLLATAGVLEVHAEQRVRGSVERSYRLRQERPVIDADAAAAMSLDEHRRGFGAAMAALLAEFQAYLGRDGADPVADSVSYRQFTLWLSDAELAEMIDEVSAALISRARNQPAAGRTPHLLATIMFPTDRPDPREPGQ
ncbi:MAG: helix-turn-helix domain-containing protein [Actinocatenispora sp.]